MNEIAKNEAKNSYLDVESGIENWNKVRNFIDSYFKKLLTNIKIDNFIIACEEIYVNISRYAYSGKKGNVRIKCDYISDKKEISVEFVDYGKAFDPTNYAISNINLPLEKRKIGGLGIFMAKKLSDSMEYKRIENKNILIIRKNK